MVQMCITAHLFAASALEYQYFEGRMVLYEMFVIEGLTDEILKT